jgi:hypothetical protein
MPPLDFEGALIVWLRPFLAVDERIGADKPDEPYQKAVVVAQIGGVFRPPVVDVPTIQLDAWGPTKASAKALASKVRARIFSLRPRPGVPNLMGAVPIYNVEEFAQPGYLPDPDTGEPRYRWTVSIQHREHLEVS